MAKRHEGTEATSDDSLCARDLPWVSLHVDGASSQTKDHREHVAERVLKYFHKNAKIPVGERVLCLLDGRDEPQLRATFGEANRGMHWPIRGQGLRAWPTRMWNVIAPPDGIYGQSSWPYTSIIYLYERTCQSDIGLTLTLAHELQHFLQYVNARSLWAANVLLGKLPGLPTEDLRAWWDFPVEKESRVVAKRVAEGFFGQERVRGYIQDRIKDRVTEQDAEDWEFIATIDVSVPYNAVPGTKSLVDKYRVALKRLQVSPEWLGQPDVSAIDFDNYEWLGS
jgi:hypothetical protein